MSCYYQQFFNSVFQWTDLHPNLMDSCIVIVHLFILLQPKHIFSVLDFLEHFSVVYIFGKVWYKFVLYDLQLLYESPLVLFKESFTTNL